MDDELLGYFDRYGVQMFTWSAVALASPEERERMKRMAEEEQKMPKQHYSQHPRFMHIVNPFNCDDERTHPQNEFEIGQRRREGLLDFVDFLNEETRKYSGNPSLSLEERHISFMEKDSERIEKETGISVEDANIIAVVNFRQDIRRQAKVIPPLEDTLNPKYLDETAIKLLAKMSVTAKKGLEEYWAEKFDFRRPNIKK